MKYQLIKNAVMNQGLGAYGYIQLGSTIFVWGDTGKEGLPLVQLVLFRPYSKRWFYFSINGLLSYILDVLKR